MNSVQPKIKSKKSKDYRTIWVSSVWGGHRPDFFEATIQTTTTNANATIDNNGTTVIDRTDEVTLVMTPFQAKCVRDWLDTHVKDYEKDYGKIPTIKELEKRAAGKKPTSSGQNPMFG